MQRFALVFLWVCLMVPGSPRFATSAEEGFLALAKTFEARLESAPEDAGENKPENTPGNFDAHLGLAHALNAEMARRTNANLPLVEGLQDGDANRALWSELGTKALKHARIAHELRPDSVQAASDLANAYMFYSSSLGIVSAILKGAGTEYREHAQRLIDLDPAYDDGLGDFLLSGFYLVAPWPLRDKELAQKHGEKAEKLSPGSVRNQYGLGVVHARNGDEDRARGYFKRAVENPCTANTERLFCDWMKAEAQRQLEQLGGGE